MAPLSFSSRPLVGAGLVLGLLSGCAHSGRTDQGGTESPSSSTTTVTAEELEREPREPIERFLAGRVAGVWVTRTRDGGIAVRIRGTTSIHGSNDPLFILDGVPYVPGPGGSLTGINPYDIESIEVLKDAASMTMYGIRGANGVIVIKTKRAGQ